MIDGGVVAEASQRAQEIVMPIADPVYRVAAFQVVLGRLLDDTDRSTANETSVPKAPKAGPNGRDGKGETKGRILKLRSEGFFAEPRSSVEVRTKLRTDGFHHNGADIRMALLRLAQKRELRRLQDGASNEFRYVQP